MLLEADTSLNLPGLAPAHVIRFIQLRSGKSLEYLEVYEAVRDLLSRDALEIREEAEEYEGDRSCPCRRGWRYDISGPHKSTLSWRPWAVHDPWPGEAVTGPPSGMRAYNIPNSIRPVLQLGYHAYFQPGAPLPSFLQAITILFTPDKLKSKKSAKM